VLPGLLSSHCSPCWSSVSFSAAWAPNWRSSGQQPLASFLQSWRFEAFRWRRAAGSSIVGSSNLISKVYFPRLIVPAAAVLAGLVDFGVSFLLMCIMMAIYRVPLGVNFLLLPLLIFLTAALAMGIGTWLASLNVKYRDIRHLIPFTLQLWMYVTPVAYPLSLIPRPYRALLIINPMTGLIEGYRVVLLSGINGASFNWPALGFRF
jgi:lipopolysaccharide transport system permease protein